MSSLSPRLSLKKPDGPDPFLASDFRSNYDKLDAAPGVFICTSGTRPTTWGTNQTGRQILETDTHKYYWWTGTTFLDSHAMVHAYVGSADHSVTQNPGTDATYLSASWIDKHPGLAILLMSININFPANNAQICDLFPLIDDVICSPNGATTRIGVPNVGAQNNFQQSTFVIGAKIVQGGAHTAKFRVLVNGGGGPIVVANSRISVFTTSLNRLNE